MALQTSSFSMMHRFLMGCKCWEITFSASGAFTQYHVKDHLTLSFLFNLTLQTKFSGHYRHDDAARFDASRGVVCKFDVRGRKN
jgi:hypothetical protein